MREPVEAEPDRLGRVLRHARCLIWEAEVVEDSTRGLSWDYTVLNEAAAAALLPVERRADQSYTAAWLRSRLDEDRLSSEAWSEQHLRAEEPYTQEYRCRLEDGRIRWLREEVDVERLGPRRWRACGICVDVTDRRRSEQARFQLLSTLEATTDFVSTSDPQGQLLYLNPALRRLLGLGRQADPAALSPRELYPEWAERRLRQEALPAALRNGSWQGEAALRAAEGREVPVSLVITVHRSPEGRPQFLSTIARDISDRKRIEEALREAESRFRVMAEASPVGIFLTDPSGASLYVNPEMQRQSGLREHSPQDRQWADAMHPEDRATVQAGWAAAIAQGQRYEQVHRFRHTDGKVVWVRVTAAPVRDGETMVGYVGVSIDVTRRRNLEEQLRQAQKMEAVGRLAGGVAHDFNNMLAVINGYCDLLLRTLREEDRLHGPLREIRKAGERAAGLTRQLLAYSRRQMLEPRNLELNELLENLARMLHRLLGEDVDLVLETAPRPVQVHADPGQVEQVVINLAVNARDAMPQGGRLTIRVGTVDRLPEDVTTDVTVAERPHALIHVSDTGCGIPEEVAPHIFEPFFTTKGPGQGTGLGLATVYGIVSQSDGHITVESEPGQGTSFRVFLPQIHVESVRSPAEEGAVVPGGRGTLLLVEDEPMVRTLTRSILETSGYTILEAANGEAALQICREHPGRIDLILTDVVMPHMSGRELAEQAEQCRPKVPVLYMSGYTDDAILRSGLSGSAALIHKPFTPAALVQRVQEMLVGDDRAQGRGAAIRE